MNLTQYATEIRRYLVYGAKKVGSSFFCVDEQSIREFVDDGLIRIAFQDWDEGSRWEISWNMEHGSSYMYVAFISPSFSLGPLQYIFFDEKPLAGINYNKVLYVFKCGLLYYLQKLLSSDKRITSSWRIRATTKPLRNPNWIKASKYIPYLPSLTLRNDNDGVDVFVYFHPFPVKEPIVYVKAKLTRDKVIELKRSFKLYAPFVDFIVSVGVASSAYGL